MVDTKEKRFLEAYEACHAAFVRYCSAITYGKMDTEDLIQDVLLSAYQHFEKIKELLDLHQSLYPMVIQDGFIKSKKFAVIIEKDKEDLRINGNVVSGDQRTKYQSSISKYKIKPAPFRSIRLTEHQIKVGDFSSEQFTGSSSTIGDY